MTLNINYDILNLSLKEVIEINEINYNEIDKNMVDIIKLLNKKRYATAFCCGGHLKIASSSIYISFYVRVEEELPKGFKLEKGFFGDVIRYLLKKETQQEIDSQIEILKLWVENLPIKQLREKNYARKRI